jgi:hypothetical protein
MAVTTKTYCSAATGFLVGIDYDDVAHSIVSYDPAISGCSGGVVAGTEIYSHVDGGSTWSLRVQNSAPYAYVVEIPIVSCTVSIDSIDVVNSTTDESANGSITINATGSGDLEYSINNGATYQSSNLFENLTPGSYNVKVKNVYAHTACYDSDVAVVGFTTLVCDLTLGAINTTAAPGATLTIVTVNTAKPYAVEYRLDAGAWQDSPVFTGLAAGTYNVQVRFKLYTGCSDARNVDVSAAACDIQLLAAEVTHETERYANNGTITIYGTSADTISYSIDDGDSYQAENLFEGLAPGEYVVRIKNTVAGCEASVIVTVLRYKRPLLNFPQTNAHRVVILSGPVADLGKQNMDNKLFNTMRFIGVDLNCYNQKFAASQPSKIQFRSSYTNNVVKLYTATGVLTDTLTPVKQGYYLAIEDIRVANFTDAGSGKTQIWFSDGMPNIYEVGQPISVIDEPLLNGDYVIEEMRAGTGDAEGAIVLIIDKVYTDPTITANVVAVYDIEAYDVYEVLIDWPAYAVGNYYLRFEGSDTQLEAYTAQTEPVELVESTDGLIVLTYYNYDNAFNIDYITGIRFTLLVEGELLPDNPGGEREEMDNSQRRPLVLREYVTRIMNMIVEEVPPYLAEKIALALAHDVKYLDGIEYGKSSDVVVEYPDPYDPFANVTAKLRKSDFLSENQDDDVGDRGIFDASFDETFE